MRKRRISRIILVLALCLGLMSSVALASESPVSTWADAVTDMPAGYTESDNTVTISTAEELAWFAKQVNTGVDYSSKTVQLTKDMDLTGKLWMPIGTTEHPYHGTFDGQGHRIEGMTTDENQDYQGFFGVVGGGTVTIQNLVISSTCNILGKNYVGAIVGGSDSSDSFNLTITKCGNEAPVTASGRNGAGIFGVSMNSKAVCTFSNCYNTGSIESSNEGGAISGWLGNNATVENCWSSGLVSGIQSGKAFARFGSAATFTNCYLLDTAGSQAGINAFAQDDLASGKLCGLLGPAWGQVIGTDPLPDFATSSNTVYICYESGSCIKKFTNDGSFGSDSPTHDDNYDSMGKCLVCGDIKPGSIYETGLDLTGATEDMSGVGWSWDASTKTLALSDFQLSTSNPHPLKVPHNTTITLSGTNNISSTAESAVGIHSTGSLTMQGVDSSAKLYISVESGTAIKCESSTENTTLSVKNLSLETHPYSVVVETKANKNAAFEVSDSNVRLGQITVVNTEASKTSTETAKFSVSNSTLYAQCAGTNVNVATLTGNKIDVEIINSDVTLWNSGWGQNWGHAYGMRLNSKGTSDINFSDSNLMLYSMHAGIWSDALSDNGYTSTSGINNCSIVAYSKNEAALCFMDNDTDSNGYGNDNVTEALLAGKMTNSILIQCEAMEQAEESREVSAVLVGSPNLKKDFILSKNIGAISDITQYMDSQTLTLSENQTLTAADGVTVTLSSEMSLVMSAGSSISGTVNAEIDSAADTFVVSFDYGDSVKVNCVSANTTVSAPTEPTKPGHTFDGWYSDEELTTPWNFDTETVDTDITLYAKWTANTAAVTFNANGGTGTMDSQTFTTGTAQELAPNMFTRGGYTFTGWNTAADGSGTAYADKQSLTLTEDLTLYAQWQVEPVTPPTVNVHYCAGKCDICGDCKDADCTWYVCKNKCLMLSITFTDVEESKWYTDAVEYVYHRDMMQGIGNNLFDINGTTTRAMIVTILWRREGEPSYGQGKSGTFADVPEDTWYTEAVEWAAANGIVEGWNGKFDPTGDITREQFATILWRYAKYKGYDVSVGENTNILSYEDAFDISEYAIPAMQWACGSGLMEGDGVNLTPTANATRSQAAALLMRFCALDK